MKSFFSLLISFALVSLGDIVSMSIAYNISLAAIGVMGAYYTVNWIVKELTNFGVYTYRVERKDEWQYLQIALWCGLAGGIAVSLFSQYIPEIFGIDAAQKAAFASILSVYFLALPLKTLSIATLEMVRLRNMLVQYRRAVIGFYLVAIPVNLAMFIIFHEVFYIIVADMAGNFFIVLYIVFCLRKEVPFQWLTRKQVSNALRFGSPLVGERLVYRLGVSVYGVCASYLPAELYAIHTVCLSAVGIGEIGDQAYSAALMVLVPDATKEEDSKERYDAERARMIAYRKKTALLAVVFSIAIAYVAGIASHGETELGLAMWLLLFYCVTFIPMCISTPGKDFLTIQKKPGQVMAGTLVGIPLYVVLPLLAITLLPPDVAIYVFALTGAAQVSIRAIVYALFIAKMDKLRGANISEIRQSSRDVTLDATM